MSKRNRFIPAILLVSLVGLFEAYAGELGFEDRVRCQEAIERVYHSHRIGATMAVDEVVTREMLEAKVHTHLQKSAALEKIWNTPVTAHMLQQEVERMIGATRMPGRLDELFRAVGNDTVLIRECLARPTLVDRLSRNFFDYDMSIHAENRRQAEALRENLLSKRDVSYLAGGSPMLLDISPIASDEGRPTRTAKADSPHDGFGGSTVVNVTTREFELLRERTSGRAGEVGPVTESRTAFTVDVTVSWNLDTIRLARYAVKKRDWNEWWEGVRTEFEGIVPDVASSVDEHSSALLFAQSPFVPSCSTGDQWEQGVMNDLPDPRTDHTAVWTGNIMIVWGGYSGGEFNTGSRYDPATDTWSRVSTTNAPSPRQSHTAVWTGDQMIVWGGVVTGRSPVWFNDGGRYDPTTDTWASMSTVSAPVVRAGHHAFWIGDQMIVFGGFNCCNNHTNGGRYDPAIDRWMPMADPSNLPFRSGFSAVWTGREMIVWGGYDGSYRDTGEKYDPRTNRWSPMSALNAPPGRRQALAVWTGGRMIIWGGTVGSKSLNSGGQYDPVADTWTTTSLDGAPRFGHSNFTAIWTGSEMIVWGGSRSQSLLIAGRYDPLSDRWASLSNTNAPVPRFKHTAVWTGGLMIVWGGTDGYSRINNGGRYDPVTDSWTPTSLAGAPEARTGHTVVWTGNVMIVWGSADRLNTGGRYDPAIDSWSSTSTAGAPERRAGHTAVWTGNEMIVWGGTNGTAPGARYDPVADSWAPISNVNAPFNRTNHSAVWTDREMIVWGGVECTPGCAIVATGGRYDPETDMWTATSPGLNARQNHTAVWTGREMIIWGGHFVYSFAHGARYDPASDTWFSMTFVGNPAARTRHTAVWTGSEMLVWGGANCSPYNCVYHDSGGRYDPSSDLWVHIPFAGAPSRRWQHTAVWTGDVMIVWGGRGEGSCHDTGGRYSPSTDSWSPLSMDNAPPKRCSHTAVWTGTQMLVWGGSFASALNSGGRYCACATSFFFPDEDGDGFGDPGRRVEACDRPADHVENNADCDDGRADVHPQAFEICNGADDNCDGGVDEIFDVGQPCEEAIDVCSRLSGVTACRSDESGVECRGDIVNIDTTAPSIICPDDATLECPASSAMIGTPGVSDTCDPQPVLTNDAPAALPLGMSGVTWTATDANGNVSSCMQSVSVVDSTPPIILEAVTPVMLWPPNHRMVEIQASISASDSCSSPTVVLTSIASNEPDDSEGDGDTINDIQDAQLGSADFSFSLRAERAGRGGGRIYTASYKAVDGSGNEAFALGYVLVPHDQGGETEPLEVAVEENGSGTILRWNPVAGAEHYNAIRGQLSSIRTAGAAIDLGSVVCLQSGARQTNTLGREDVVTPDPGAAFFYLVEYVDVHSSSYGTLTAGKPRVAGQGVCQ